MSFHHPRQSSHSNMTIAAVPVARKQVTGIG
jgi:hypothetical protein